MRLDCGQQDNNHFWGVNSTLPCPSFFHFFTPKTSNRNKGTTKNGAATHKSPLRGPLGLVPFTGKERDEETGYSYFGARYMDHDLMTLWLSVDPMADKYPSTCPYAYCFWNPIKLVDPNGMEIDDYFSFDGEYLGSDDAETDYIRIINEFTWNHLTKNQDGLIDHETGYSSSISFSDACAKGMSDNAQLSVYQHYNPTVYTLEAAPPEEITSSSPGMITKIGSSGRETRKSVLTHFYIKLKENSTPNMSGDAMCDNANEILNAFIHEENHIQ